MWTVETAILWMVGVPVLGILFFLLRSHFKADKRARRRGESHRPVISPGHGPTVQPPADADKAKRHGNR